MRSSILPRQSRNLQHEVPQHVLLLRGQRALLDLREAFHIVHGANDGDGHFDVALGGEAEIFQRAHQEVAHLVVGARVAASERPVMRRSIASIEGQSRRTKTLRRFQTVRKVGY